jgi:PTS system nitrogen regulatory IIA component
MHPPDPGPPLPGLASIFPPQAIVVGLRGRGKAEVIAELAHHLVRLGQISEVEAAAAVGDVLAREKRAATAPSHGIAFPHCRCPFTQEFVGALGIEPGGVPFGAADGEPVDAVFLILAPPGRPEELYDLLGRITALGRDKSRRYQLRGCRTPEAVSHLLQELDRQ